MSIGKMTPVDSLAGMTWVIKRMPGIAMAPNPDLLMPTHAAERAAKIHCCVARSNGMGTAQASSLAGGGGSDEKVNAEFFSSR